MKEFFKDILTDKITSAAFGISFIFILLSLLIVLFSFHNLPPFIPIFNQMPWGTERIGSTITIFFPLLAILIIFITNSIFASLLYKKIPLLSRILLVTGLILAVLVFLFVIKINLLII